MMKESIQQRQRQRRQQTNDLSEPSRPLLIYNHNPKAGGGSVINVLHDIFNCTIEHDLALSVRDFIASDIYKNLTQQQKTKEDRRRRQCWLYVREFGRTTKKDRELGFIIGSIREPCSHYQSLWAYTSTGQGARYDVIKGYNMLGKDGPYFNSTDDVFRFRTFIQYPEHKGLMVNRFKYSYGGRGNGVDCWVYCRGPVVFVGTMSTHVRSPRRVH